MTTEQQTISELKATLALLQAQLKARTPKLSFKVSDKGAVSVYGLGRFPVTLYESQWLALIALIPELSIFLATNQSKLARKGTEMANETPQAQA